MKTFGWLSLALLVVSCGQNNSSQTFSPSGPTVESIDFINEIEEAPPASEFIDQLPEDSTQISSSGYGDWAPTGARLRESPPECRQSSLNQLLKNTGTNPREFQIAVSQFFSKCEKYLEEIHMHYWGDVRLSQAKYQVSENRNIKQVELKFSNGDRLRGYLALKPDLKKRPFVIARCGVFCNINGRVPRVLLMHLFDESPFNVLVLANVTGSHFVTDNLQFGLGGYLEATQHLKIAEFLRSEMSSLSHRISEVHVLGVSLGGNGALMSSLLSDENPRPDGTSPISSSIALCPVVNLGETMEAVLGNDIRGRLMGDSTWEVLRKLYEARGETVPKNRPSNSKIRELSTIEGLRTYNRIFNLGGWGFAPFIGWDFSSVDNAVTANQFELCAKSVKTPTFVLGADDDPIVPIGINSKRLTKMQEQFPDSSVGAVITPKGGHCAQSVVYGWNTVSETVRQFFLNHSPAYRQQSKVRSLQFASRTLPPHLRNLKSEEYHFSQQWKATTSYTHLELEFKIWSPNTENKCEEFGPYFAFEGCFRTVSINVPMSYFNSDAVQTPWTKAEAEALTRWANTNLVVFGTDKKELNHTRALPEGAMWTEY